MNVAAVSTSTNSQPRLVVAKALQVSGGQVVFGQICYSILSIWAPRAFNRVSIL